MLPLPAATSVLHRFVHAVARNSDAVFPSAQEALGHLEDFLLREPRHVIFAVEEEEEGPGLEMCGD